jgi:HTH-type transcriptional regulator/antitoxin HipB
MDFPIRTADQLNVILRALRRARNLTQKELADRLGVTQQALSQLELDPQSASFERVLAVLSALGVTIVLRDGADGSTDEAAW